MTLTKESNWPNLRRLRFSPSWDPDDTCQVRGLIELSLFANEYFGSQEVTLVEIGSYSGESACIFASFGFIQKIHCIDIWQTPSTYEAFLFRLQSEIASGRVTFQRMKSIEAASRTNIFCPDLVNWVYIDASHQYSDVKADIEAWSARLSCGGLISGHDYCDNHPGVKQAVDEHAQNTGRNILKYSDCSWAIV